MTSYSEPIRDTWTCRRPGCDLVSRCAVCGRGNRAGHEMADHMDFKPVVDPTGPTVICDLHAVMLANSEFVTFHLSIPAAEAVGW